MHILFGLLVGAVLIVWWARGGLVPAVMLTIVAAGLMLAAMAEPAVPGMVISLILGVFAWAPLWFWNQRRAVMILPPTGAVQPYRR